MVTLETFGNEAKHLFIKTLQEMTDVTQILIPTIKFQMAPTSFKPINPTKSNKPKLNRPKSLTVYRLESAKVKPEYHAKVIYCKIHSSKQ
jgi:hypothetical protein